LKRSFENFRDGQYLDFEGKEEMVSINHNGEASIVIADWQASIGVIHVIDRILDESAKPGSDTLLSAFSTAESLSTFAQLLESSGVLSGNVGSDTSFAPKSKDLEQFSTEDDTESCDTCSSITCCSYLLT